MKPSPVRSYQTILDSIADGVFTVDKQWRITFFNKAAEKITGIDRREAIGQQCWEVFRAEVCESDCVLKKTMTQDTSIVNQTVYIVNSKGRKVPISVSTALLKDEKGAVYGGVETFRDMSEVEELKKELRDKHTFHDIITADHRMLGIFDTLPALARSEGTVLVLGDSGTGKELLARAIHDLSNRSNGPFVVVNCGALPDTLLESELFGYRKGAFTDAKNDKPGRFDLARGGTIFLDEIGDVSKAVQVKLLRVLQEKTYEPLGSTASVMADVRVVAATNRDVEAMVATGEFRKDFYYRINVIPIRLPSLSQRKLDIPLLAEHFLSRLNIKYHKEIGSISDEALALLMSHEYPGNIRELENVIHHAFIVCVGKHIEKKHLPEYLHTAKTGKKIPVETVADFETQKIREALERNRYNKINTAKELAIHPATLWRKMKKHKIC